MKRILFFLFSDGIEKVVGIFDPARTPGNEFYWTMDPEVKWAGMFSAISLEQIFAYSRFRK